MFFIFGYFILLFQQASKAEVSMDTNCYKNNDDILQFPIKNLARHPEWIEQEKYLAEKQVRITKRLFVDKENAVQAAKDRVSLLNATLERLEAQRA